MATQKETEILNGLLSKGSEAPKLSLSVKSMDQLLKELNFDKQKVEDYRTVQSVELTKIQQRILNAITDDKLESASLSELTRAYVLLKDKELVMNGKATAITGIVGYLIALEKEDLEKKSAPVEVNEIEASYTVCDPEDEMPDL